MRFVTLASGEKIPALGLGTWHMGERRSDRVTEAKALQAGLDFGLNLIDTAEMYGESNTWRCRLRASFSSSSCFSMRIGGENLNGGLASGAVPRQQRKAHPGTLGPPNPVALHRQHFFGPADQSASSAVEQFVGVGGDAEEPLLQLARGHDGVPQRQHPPSTTCSLASTV